MKTLSKVKAGTQQTRIKESSGPDSKLYYYYSADMLRDDICGIEEPADPKQLTQIRTTDGVATIKAGELVISLVTGETGIVSNLHDGYLITQNFATIESAVLDPGFIMFLFNEVGAVKQQLWGDNYGMIKRLSVSAIEKFTLDNIPDMATQKRIGEVYRTQKHLSYLRKQSQELRDEYTMGSLKKLIKL